MFCRKMNVNHLCMVFFSIAIARMVLTMKHGEHVLVRVDFVIKNAEKMIWIFVCPTSRKIPWIWPPSMNKLSLLFNQLLVYGRISPSVGYTIPVLANSWQVDATSVPTRSPERSPKIYQPDGYSKYYIWGFHKREQLQEKMDGL